jgi:hypothetical protein
MTVHPCSTRVYLAPVRRRRTPGTPSSHGVAVAVLFVLICNLESYEDVLAPISFANYGTGYDDGIRGILTGNYTTSVCIGTGLDRGPQIFHVKSVRLSTLAVRAPLCGNWISAPSLHTQVIELGPCFFFFAFFFFGQQLRRCGLTIRNCVLSDLLFATP